MRNFLYLFRSDMAGASGSAAAPVLQTERISIIDTVRGIALLGILLMNIPYFAEAYMVGDNIFIFNETSGINYYTWWIVNGAFEGTMRALFSLLFGAGTVLLLTRLDKTVLPKLMTPADIYYRRLFILLAFGVINAFWLLWPGDILYNYAICGLFLYPFRNWKPKGLLILGLVLMLFTSYKETRTWYKAKKMRVQGEHAMLLKKDSTGIKKDTVMLGKDSLLIIKDSTQNIKDSTTNAKLKTDTTKKLTEKQEAALGQWKGFKERMKKENILKEVEKVRKLMRGGYFEVKEAIKPFNIKFESIKLYKFWFWDVIALFFIGMALFKWGVITGKRSNRFYIIMILVCYGIGFAVNYWFLRNTLNLGRDPTRYADKFLVNIYQERRLLQALGHMSLVILLYKNNILGFLWKWLSRVGQMAFSNYLMQSIICTLFFYGYGFGMFGKLQRYEWYIVVGIVWVFQIIFSNVWLHYFRFGPFEWLWRSMTYWKKQPMKRKKMIDDN